MKKTVKKKVKKSKSDEIFYKVGIVFLTILVVFVTFNYEFKSIQYDKLKEDLEVADKDTIIFNFNEEELDSVSKKASYYKRKFKQEQIYSRELERIHFNNDTVETNE